MAKQIINVGTGSLAGDGEAIRDAFIKTNENFDEIYDAIATIPTDVSELNDSEGLLGGTGGSVNRSWASENGTIFNTIDWASGRDVTITATPYEISTFITYEERTDSNEVVFVWDQGFIDNVWDGYNTEAGEGENFSVSFDNGETWYAVEKSGYSGNLFFYFYIPWELQNEYSFTYGAGEEVLVRYNRGSIMSVWFDLEDAPVPASNVVAVSMSVVVDATVTGTPNRSAKIVYPEFRFSNALYDDDTGEGDVELGYDIWTGDEYARDLTDIDIRKSAEAADAGRVYTRFSNGRAGNMKFYWNAKLYTIQLPST